MPIFNGYTILNQPPYPSAAMVEFTAFDSIAQTRSPFTGQNQIQNWRASWMEASVSMPPMPLATARAWYAWLMGLQGVSSIFLFGDPLAAAPMGTGAGSPIVSGSGQTGYALNTSGWSGANALLPGDYFSIGYRLYCNLGVVNGGSQTLAIWPQIRESPPDGTPIIVVNPTGMFRLKENARKWSVSDMRMYGMEFTIQEAI